MTSLGTYLLICLAFVFFTIAVLALVLLVHENGMRKTGITKEGSKSEVCVDLAISLSDFTMSTLLQLDTRYT